MALHINLYHEIQSQARARRRDPLKLAMLGMLAIGLGFVAYYFVCMGSLHSVNNRLAAVEGEWKKIEPRAKEAKKTEDELTTNIKTSETLVKQIENRFYWAPIFEGILQLVPRDAQIIKLAGELGGDGKPSAIIVTGVAGSGVPRKVAEDLRTALDDKLSEKFKSVTSSFRSLEDSEEAVMINGQRFQTANFTMEFHITTTEPAAQAAAPARKPKS
jgi:hypothetical protein